MPPPTCWKCNYNLSGLQVDDLCPECGTPVWSQRPPEVAHQAAQNAQLWGILSLVLMFACIGPLAVIPAAIALRYAANAERETRVGPEGRVAPAAIRTGRICAWITICFSVATFVIWGVVVATAGFF